MVHARRRSRDIHIRLHPEARLLPPQPANIAAAVEGQRIADKVDGGISICAPDGLG